MEHLALATGLTLFAGLSTCIGGLIGIAARPTSMRFLSMAMGFAAGAMLYVSFVEILPKAEASLVLSAGERWAPTLAVSGFFAGILLTAIIDRLVPREGNPHEFSPSQRLTAVGASDPAAPGRTVRNPRDARLMRMGLLTGLAISIHNFPEGLATFIATLENPAVGLPIALAIAVHNIPEGIAVAVPIHHATGSKRKAFLYASLSGIAEPIGALVGYFLVLQWFSGAVFGCVFAGVAGVMVFISLDQLLPAAEEYGEHHLTIYGLVAGLAVMAVSLLLFGL